MEATTLQRSKQPSAANRALKATKTDKPTEARDHALEEARGNLASADMFASRLCACINHLAEEMRSRLRPDAGADHIASADSIADLIAHRALQLSDSIGQCASDVGARCTDPEEMREQGEAEASQLIAEVDANGESQDCGSAAATSILSTDSVDYVSARLSQAHAIVSMAHTAICELPKDEQPDAAAVFVSLERAGSLLHEAQEHLDEAPETKLILTCGTDPWWNPLHQAGLLLDMFEAIAWADGYVNKNSDELLSDFLWAVRDTIDQARQGLNAATDAKLAV